MTGPKLTGKARDALGGDVTTEVEIPMTVDKKEIKSSRKDDARAQKIARKEAKLAEKRAKKDAKKQSKLQTPTASITPTQAVTGVTEVKERKTMFEKLEDVITLVFTMTLGVLGLVELLIGVITELPDILKWLVKFVLFSGAFGSKESKS